MSAAVHRFFPFNLVLPNMPGVAAQLMRSFSDDNMTLNRLADLIGQDPALAAKVLRLANSARYSPLRSVSSLREATASLGMTMLRNLTMATSLSGAFPSIHGLDQTRFWRHGMATAHYAVLLARACMIDAETAYLGGLMLRTGQLLMLQMDKLGVAELEKQIQLPGDRFSLAQQRWACTHSDVTAELARRWQFPDALVSAFQATAWPLQAQPFSGLGAVLRLAEALADTMDLQQPPIEAMQQALPELIARLRLNPAWLADKLLDPAALAEDAQLMTGG
jgi:HD-like signal output (HDOD) protein